MQAFTLYRADVTGDAKNADYPTRCEIRSAADLAEAVQFDHVAAEYAQNHRANDRFICSDCLMMDLDNTHTDTPAEWKSLDDVKAAFPGVAFYAVPSRNHMKEKNGKAARPKYHFYFPIHPVMDAGRYADLKAAAIRAFPWFDAGAADAARLFFGTAAATPDGIIAYEGETK